MKEKRKAEAFAERQGTIQPKTLLELTIEDYGMEGEGVAHAGGVTFFVPYAMKGERIKAEVQRVKGGVAFARIIKLISPSPDRRPSPCSLFGKCGGCSLCHLPYETQLAIKKENVIRLFKKNCDLVFSDLSIEKSEEFGYRNKVALPFGEEKGKPVLGLYKKGTHKVLPLSSCPLHGNWIDPLVRAASDFAFEKKLTVYNEETGKGLLRHLVARRLTVKGEVNYSVILVANAGKIPFEQEFAKRISSALGNAANVYLCKNTQRNNVILTSEIRTLLGEDCIRAEMAGGVWEVSPLSFLQVNFPLAEKLYESVVRWVPEGSFVVDAYSGTGIMSALIAKRAQKVIGIEVIEDATVNAKKNAERFGVKEKVEHLCGEVEQILPKIVQNGEKYVLVVDPPRAGLHESVVKTILANPPESIVYVSCSPATLTRDLKALTDGGFAVSSVRLFDLFPNTPHVETLCLLRKQ